MVNGMILAVYNTAMFLGCISAIIALLFGGGICLIYLTEWIKDLRKRGE